MAPPVHVVLVNYDGWRDTVECMESVLRSDHPDVRIILVDNASSDDSVKRILDWAEGRLPAPASSMAHASLTTPPVVKPVRLEECGDADPLDAITLGPRVMLVRGATNRGFAGGNNLALGKLLSANASGYACLLNTDMVVAPDALAALVRGIAADPALGAIGGVILDYAKPGLVQSVGGGRISRLGMAALAPEGLAASDARCPQDLHYVSGGLLLLSMETLRAVGVMDEDYFLYAEDADWGLRMRRMGYRLGCTLDARVWHKGSASIVAGSPFQDYYVTRATLMFVRRHWPWLAPVALMNAIGRFLLPKLLRGERTRAAAVRRAIRDYRAGKVGPGPTSAELNGR